MATYDPFDPTDSPESSPSRRVDNIRPHAPPPFPPIRAMSAAPPEIIHSAPPRGVASSVTPTTDLTEITPAPPPPPPIIKPAPPPPPAYTAPPLPPTMEKKTINFKIKPQHKLLSVFARKVPVVVETPAMLVPYDDDESDSKTSDDASKVIFNANSTTVNESNVIKTVSGDQDRKARDAIKNKRIENWKKMQNRKLGEASTSVSISSDDNRDPVVSEDTEQPCPELPGTTSNIAMSESSKLYEDDVIKGSKTRISGANHEKSERSTPRESAVSLDNEDNSVVAVKRASGKMNTRNQCAETEISVSGERSKNRRKSHSASEESDRNRSAGKSRKRQSVDKKPKPRYRSRSSSRNVDKDRRDKHSNDNKRRDSRRKRSSSIRMNRKQKSFRNRRSSSTHASNNHSSPDRDGSRHCKEKSKMSGTGNTHSLSKEISPSIDPPVIIPDVVSHENVEKEVSAKSDEFAMPRPELPKDHVHNRPGVVGSEIDEFNQHISPSSKKDDRIESIEKTRSPETRQNCRSSGTPEKSYTTSAVNVKKVTSPSRKLSSDRRKMSKDRTGVKHDCLSRSRSRSAKRKQSSKCERDVSRKTSERNTFRGSRNLREVSSSPRRVSSPRRSRDAIGSRRSHLDRSRSKVSVSANGRSRKPRKSRSPAPREGMRKKRSWPRNEKDRTRTRRSSSRSLSPERTKKFCEKRSPFNRRSLKLPRQDLSRRRLRSPSPRLQDRSRPLMLDVYASTRNYQRVGSPVTKTAASRSSSSTSSTSSSQSSVKCKTVPRVTVPMQSGNASVLTICPPDSKSIKSAPKSSDIVDAEWTALGTKVEVEKTSSNLKQVPSLNVDDQVSAHLPSVISDDSCKDRVKKVIDEKVQCWSTDKRASIDQWLQESSEPATEPETSPSTVKSKPILKQDILPPPGIKSSLSSIQQAAQQIQSIISTSQRSNSAAQSPRDEPQFSNDAVGPFSHFMSPFFPTHHNPAPSFPVSLQNTSSIDNQAFLPTSMSSASNLITIQTNEFVIPTVTRETVPLSTAIVQPTNKLEVLPPLPQKPQLPSDPSPIEPEAPPMPSPSYSPSLSPIPSKSAGHESEADFALLESQSNENQVIPGVASKTLQNLQDILMNIKPGPRGAALVDVAEKKASPGLSDFTPPGGEVHSTNKKLDELERLFPPVSSSGKKRRHLPKTEKPDKSIRIKKNQELVADLAKKYLKPYFTKNKLTKDQYKHIMRKVVFKCTDGKKGEVKSEKVKKLVVNYAAHMLRKPDRKTSAVPTT